MKNLSTPRGLATVGTTLLVVCTLLHSKPAQSQTMPKTTRTTTQHSNMNVKGFETNLEKATVNNRDFRKVLYTAQHLQLVLMTLKPGEDIGLETHPIIDQFFRFESGHGQCIINGHEYNVKAGDAIIVPAGARHNVINTDRETELTMYTIYAGPNHKDGLVRATKKEADAHGIKFDGKTTE